MISNSPLVSTIALCYNQGKFVEETLESIRAQTYQNIELIIIDDSSSDNSVEVIENWINKTRYPCVFIKHQNNQGICKTLNEAFRHCKGQYLQMIACDDIMLPEKTAIQTDYLGKYGDDVAVVYSDAYLMKDDGSECYGWFIQRHRQFEVIPAGNIYDELLAGPYIPAMSTLIKTEAINQIGEWDEELAYEDYDMWLRLSKCYKFEFSPYVSVKYRLHSSNSHKFINFAESQFLIFSKHLSSNVARKQFSEWFFYLYSKGMATARHKKKYQQAFPNSLSAKLISAGFPYVLYRCLMLVKNKIF